MRRPNQIIILCCSFLAGVVLAANFFIVVKPELYLLVLALSCIALLKVKSKIGYVIFFSIGILLGVWRYGHYIGNQLPSALNVQGQNVVVVGAIEGEPRWDEYRNYVFYLKNAKVDGVRTEGLIRIKTIAGFAKEGQVVAVSGKLKPGLGKAETLISYAQVSVINFNQPLMIQIKQTFIAGLDTTLPKDSAAFMSGILIGSRSALPKQMQEVLLVLGLSHIVAVSGYNLTILVGFLQRRFIKNWRWGGLVISLWIILGFVIISGASASIMRAGVMCALFLLASYYGKRLDILVCMSLVALAMIMVTPASILSDIGWQLSFLSLLGIAVLSPKISHILPSKPALLNDILSVTLSAQLATAGLIAYKFGQISLIAPLSNLLVMPFIPLLMLLGFVSAIAGILVPSIAFMTIGRPINWLVVILFDLLSYLASWRFASIKVNTVPLRLVTIYYSAVLAIPFYVRTPTKPLSEAEKNDTIDVEKAGPAKRSLPKSAYIEI